MNEISTEVKTYAVVTYTGVHYLITENQESQLRNLGLNDEIDIDGNIVKMKNIADILTIQKYYETYPDKKPDPRFNLPDYNPPQKSRTKDQRIKEQNSLLKGLKDELDMAKFKGEPYQNMEVLYRERLKKLLRLQNGDIEIKKPQEPLKKTEFVNVKQRTDTKLVSVKNSFAEILKNYAE